MALFDDRLEVENPGLLPFGLTVADLPLAVSKLRNRVIGRVLHELGLVEQWDSGIQRLIAACREVGLTTPVFEEIGFTRTRLGNLVARVGAPLGYWTAGPPSPLLCSRMTIPDKTATMN